MNRYETVEKVVKSNEFIVQTSKDQYMTHYVIIATGYYDHPNILDIPGEICRKFSLF